MPIGNPITKPKTTLCAPLALLGQTIEFENNTAISKLKNKAAKTIATFGKT